MIKQCIYKIGLSLASLLVLLIASVTHSSADDKIVRIWHTEPNNRSLSAMRDIIADYERLNPGIRIEQEAIGWGSLLQKLQAALAAGAPPDAAHGYTGLILSLS